MSQNLIPTPRTDKNGVTVIRHLKPESAVSSAAAKKDFPSPGSPTFEAATQERFEERQQLRDRIFELAVEPTTTGPSGPVKLPKSLSVIHDSDYLQRALEVAEAINASNRVPHEKGYEWWKFSEELRRRKAIEVAHRNLDLIRQGTKISNGFSAMLELHRELAAKDEAIYGSPGFPIFVERMDAHLSSYNALRDSPFYGDSRDYDVYVKKYAPLVSKYPDHSEQLCAYLVERGGAANFDEGGFAEYLNASVPLAGGTL